MRIAGVLLVPAIAACAGSKENFLPAEHATATSPRGRIAADYEMIVEGERLGDAIVWSNGAYRAANGRTVVHVGLQIENGFDIPIILDARSLVIRAEGDGRIISRDEPVALEGRTTIQPGREEVVSIFFLMPEGVNPQELDAFRLTWTARAGDLTYTQRTPFMEYEMNAAYLSHPYSTPFWDPFFYPVPL